VGKRSRTKGASFERRVAKWLRDAGIGDFWRQTDEPQQGNSGDVRDVSVSVPITLQVKKGKAPSPWKAMKEAEEGADFYHPIPIAIVHRDQRKPGEGAEQLVLMRPDVFMGILKVLSEGTAYKESGGRLWGRVRAHVMDASEL
jgi:hypothetical protein